MIFGWCCLAATVCWGCQAFQWLQTGVWPDISTGYVLYRFGIMSLEQIKGLYEPESWKGIAKIATWILENNFGWTAFFTGMISIYPEIAFWEGVEERKRKKAAEEKPPERSERFKW